MSNLYLEGGDSTHFVIFKKTDDEEKDYDLIEVGYLQINGTKIKGKLWEPMPPLEDGSGAAFVAKVRRGLYGPLVRNFDENLKQLNPERGGDQ
jgi:hypothetical protein